MPVGPSPRDREPTTSTSVSPPPPGLNLSRVQLPALSGRGLCGQQPRRATWGHEPSPPELSTPIGPQARFQAHARTLVFKINLSTQLTSEEHAPPRSDHRVLKQYLLKVRRHLPGLEAPRAGDGACLCLAVTPPDELPSSCPDETAPLQGRQGPVRRGY